MRDCLPPPPSAPHAVGGKAGWWLDLGTKGGKSFEMGVALFVFRELETGWYFIPLISGEFVLEAFFFFFSSFKEAFHIWE